MSLRPPRSTRSDTLFPYTTLFRSADVAAIGAGRKGAGAGLCRQISLPVAVGAQCGVHGAGGPGPAQAPGRSEEHTSELQSLMRISYAVFCLQKKKQTVNNTLNDNQTLIN